MRSVVGVSARTSGSSLAGGRPKSRAPDPVTPAGFDTMAWPFSTTVTSGVKGMSGASGAVSTLLDTHPNCEMPRMTTVALTARRASMTPVCKPCPHASEATVEDVGVNGEAVSSSRQQSPSENVPKGHFREGIDRRPSGTR